MKSWKQAERIRISLKSSSAELQLMAVASDYYVPNAPDSNTLDNVDMPLYTVFGRCSKSFKE